MSRARLSLPHNTRRAHRGFTLVEMLVVAPLAIITVAVLTSFMVNMLGDALVSHTRALSTYKLQDALDRIEQDTRVTSAFMPTFSLLPAGQGRNASTSNTTDTTAFSTTNNDVILNQSATSTNPYDPTRQIVYYADQPNTCASAGKYLNRSMAIKVIYFTKDDGKGVGTTNLWRRTVVPTYNTNTGVNIDGNSVCNAPWQRDNCPTLVPSANCGAVDEKILENVASFSTDYSNDTSSGLTNSRLADTATITVTLSEKAAGKTVSSSGKVRAERTNETLDDVPTAITGLSIKNPTINTDNNPLLTSFTWSPSRYASVYSVWYQINSGATVTKVISDNFISIPSRPLDNIKVGVTALNDMGASAEATYNGLTGYNKPLWTDANLEGDWDCYSTSYACPSYTVLSSNLIVVRGMVKGGTTNSIIFTLPTGLCPISSSVYATYASSNVFARVDANADCTVKWVGGGTNAWISLDPIRYNNALANLTWTSPTLSGGWTIFSGEPFQVASDSQGRTNVRGRLTPGTITNGTTFATMPTNYREKGGGGIYPGVYSGTNVYSFETWTTDVLRSRGQGATWTTQFVLYPNNLSTAPVTTVTAQAGWTNNPYGYGTMRYTKFADGLICMQGLIMPSVVAANTVLFTPTAGQSLWPSKRQLFTVMDSGTNGTSGSVAARVDVNTNGQVTIQAGAVANVWLSLAGICYLGEL